MSLALFVAVWVAAPQIARALALEAGARLIRIGILDLPLNGLYLAYQAILYGQRRYLDLAWTLVAYSATKLSGVVLLLLAGLSVEGALVVNVLATAGALVFVLTRHRYAIRLPSRETLRSIVSIAAPLAGFTVMIQLVLVMHLWLLRQLGGAGDATLGHYVAAFNVATVARLVPFALTGVVLASIAWAIARGEDGLAAHYLRSAVRFVLVLLTPACALGALHATPIMVMIYSEPYAAGGPLLALLLCGLGAFALLETVLHALVGAGERYVMAALLLALVLVAIGLGLALVPRLGPPGAAWSLVLELDELDYSAEVIRDVVVRAKRDQNLVAS